MNPALYLVDPDTFVSTVSELVIPSTPIEKVTYVPSPVVYAYPLRPMPPETRRKRRKKSS